METKNKRFKQKVKKNEENILSLAQANKQITDKMVLLLEVVKKNQTELNFLKFALAKILEQEDLEILVKEYNEINVKKEKQEDGKEK